MLRIKISGGKLSPADQVLIDAGMPLQMPPRKMDGVPLSAQQYNRFVTLMNTLPGQDGKTFSQYVAWLGEQPEYQALPQGEGSTEMGFADKQGVLAKVYGSYKSMAKRVLMLEAPEVSRAIEALGRDRALNGW